MSNEFKVGFKLHVDSTQYRQVFTKASQTAQAFRGPGFGQRIWRSPGRAVHCGQARRAGPGRQQRQHRRRCHRQNHLLGAPGSCNALGAIPQPLTQAQPPISDRADGAGRCGPAGRCGQDRAEQRHTRCQGLRRRCRAAPANRPQKPRASPRRHWARPPFPPGKPLQRCAACRAVH